MRFLTALLHDPLARFGRKRRPSGRAAAPRRSRRPGGPAKRPDWRRRLRLGLAAVPVVALAALAGLWHSGWLGHQATALERNVLEASARHGLRIADVFVEGRKRTRRSELLETLGVARGRPILAFDPHAARQRLERLPWIRRAEVERRLPNLIYVRLEEREPLALWQHDRLVEVIDHEGAVIPGIPTQPFADLPLLVGEDAPAHAAELIAMLASEPDMAPLVSAAVRVRGRRWNLRLDGGIDVRLPETDAPVAWAQLARVQREHGVLGRDVVAIDLRIPDRLVVRTAPDEAAGETAGDLPRGGEET